MLQLYQCQIRHTKKAHHASSVRVLGCFFLGNELVCTQVVSHVIAPPPPPLELEVGQH